MKVALIKLEVEMKRQKEHDCDSIKMNENWYAHQVKKAKSQRDWVPKGLTRWAV